MQNRNLQERIADVQRFERMYERARERLGDSQRQFDEVRESFLCGCLCVCVLGVQSYVCMRAVRVSVIRGADFAIYRHMNGPFFLF